MTPHRMNIFDVKFMKEESQIISCAADCAICWIDIETESAQQLWKADGRMKKLATFGLLIREMMTFSLLIRKKSAR